MAGCRKHRRQARRSRPWPGVVERVTFHNDEDGSACGGSKPAASGSSWSSGGVNTNTSQRRAPKAPACDRQGFRYADDQQGSAGLIPLAPR